MKNPFLSFMSLTNDDLLGRIKDLVDRERHATVDLITALAVMDSRRLYFAEGCSSMFTYCTEVLRLSEHAAYDRIEAARLSRRFPVVLDHLRSGALTLTGLRLLTPHLTGENHSELLEAAQRKTKREIELLVAGLHPAAQSEAMGAPVITPLPTGEVRIELTISGDTFRKLRHVQDLLRHSIPDGDLAAIVDRALTALIVDAERTKLAVVQRPRSGQQRHSGSRHIPASVKRAVWKRDEARCAFVGSGGKRCTETAFLEFHHVEPYALGGVPTIANVELRCRGHNVFEAEEYFGQMQAKPDR